MSKNKSMILCHKNVNYYDVHLLVSKHFHMELEVGDLLLYLINLFLLMYDKSEINAILNR